MLLLDSISVSYNDRPIFRGLSLKLVSGSAVYIIGNNGVGKTTLVHTIMGLTNPEHGTIEIDGQNITSLGVHERARIGLTLVPERARVFPNLSVYENLMLAPRLYGDHESQHHFLQELYQTFPILFNRGNTRASQLSGGERQLVAFARALLVRPKILLLDEPFLGLAGLVIGQVVKILIRLQSEGISILITDSVERESITQFATIKFLRAGNFGLLSGDKQYEK